MNEGPFLNITAPRELLARLDDYRFATRKPSRAAAARELLDRALRTFFEASPAERVGPRDPTTSSSRPAGARPWDSCQFARSRPVSAGSRGFGPGETPHPATGEEGASRHRRRRLDLESGPRPRGYDKSEGAEELYRIWVGRDWRGPYSIQSDRNGVAIEAVRKDKRTYRV